MSTLLIEFEKQDYMEFERDEKIIKIPYDMVTSQEQPVLSNGDDTVSTLINYDHFIQNKQAVIAMVNNYLMAHLETNNIDIPSNLLSEEIIDTIGKMDIDHLTIGNNYADFYYLSTEIYERLKNAKKISTHDADIDLYTAKNVEIQKNYVFVGKNIRVYEQDKIKYSYLKDTKNVVIKGDLTKDDVEDLKYIFQHNKNDIKFLVDSYNPEIYYNIISKIAKIDLDKRSSINIASRIEDNNLDMFKDIQKDLGDKANITVGYTTELTEKKRTPKTLTHESNTTLNEYIKTQEMLTLFSDHINSKNYSPLERAIYAYDVVKSFQYKEVPEGEDKMNSRTLHSVILGDHIVCVGYSTFYTALLAKLNIPATDYSVTLQRDNKKVVHHKRNIVHLVDEKYNIDGIFVCDATWDSYKKLDKESFDKAPGKEKYNNDYNKYLDSLKMVTPIDKYNYFMIGFGDTTNLENVEQLNVVNFFCIDQNLVKDSKYYTLHRSSAIDLCYKLLPEEENSALDTFSGTDEEIEQELKRVKKVMHDKISTPLYGDTLISAISYIRAQEGIYQNEQEKQESIQKLAEYNDRLYSTNYKELNQMLVNGEIKNTTNNTFDRNKFQVKNTSKK